MRNEGIRRWRATALLVVGVAIGVSIVAMPAGGHVADWVHNWNVHIKPRADARYYTKTQSNARFAQRLWAVVESNHTLARGSRVTSVTGLDTGFTAVRFNRNVRNCAYLATLGSTGSEGIGDAGEINLVGEFASVNGVLVATRNSSGTPTDLSFHLAVVC
jgi:hypothetical protein